MKKTADTNLQPGLLFRIAYVSIGVMIGGGLIVAFVYGFRSFGGSFPWALSFMYQASTGLLPPLVLVWLILNAWGWAKDRRSSRYAVLTCVLFVWILWSVYQNPGVLLP